MSKKFIEALASAMTWVEEEVEFIIEGRPKKLPTLVIKGKGQQADRKNENGRLYSRKLWENSLKNPAVVSDLNGRRLLGTCPHPKDGVLDPTEASHFTRVVELREDGEVYVEHVLMPTPKGKIVETLWRSGVQLGQSSRGDGESRMEDGTEILEETNYRPRGWDFVTDPSVNDAFPTLVTEAKNGNAAATKTVQTLLSNIRNRIESKGVEGEELRGYKVLLEDVGLDPVRAEVLSLTKAIGEKLAPSRTTRKTVEDKSMKTKKKVKRVSTEELAKRLRLRRSARTESKVESRRPHQGVRSPMAGKIKAAEEALAIAMEEGNRLRQLAIKFKARAVKAEAKVSELEAEVNAAEQLIDVSISNGKLTTTVESLIGENNPRATLYRGVLSKCRSKEAAESAFDLLEEQFNPGYKDAKKKGTKTEEKATKDEAEKKKAESASSNPMAVISKGILEHQRRGTRITADGKSS